MTGVGGLGQSIARLAGVIRRHAFGNLLTQCVDAQAALGQDARRHAGLLLHETDEDVLGAHMGVVEALGLTIGQGHDFSCAVGKSFKHEYGSPMKTRYPGLCVTPNSPGSRSPLL